VIFRFVDIGGIDDHHCFLFTFVWNEGNVYSVMASIIIWSSCKVQKNIRFKKKLMTNMTTLSTSSKTFQHYIEDA